MNCVDCATIFLQKEWVQCSDVEGVYLHLPSGYSGSTGDAAMTLPGVNEPSMQDQNKNKWEKMMKAATDKDKDDFCASCCLLYLPAETSLVAVCVTRGQHRGFA